MNNYTEKNVLAAIAELLVVRKDCRDFNNLPGILKSISKFDWDEMAQNMETCDAETGKHNLCVTGLDLQSLTLSLIGFAISDKVNEAHFERLAETFVDYINERLCKTFEIRFGNRNVIIPKRERVLID